MNLLIRNNEELRRYIVNVVHEVDDETPLYDKMLPFLEQAQREVERHFIGNLKLNEDEQRAACSLIAVKAFYQAVPSLDLVLSPNGFAVVNTTNMAPASKERIERLRASLLEAYDGWADNLLAVLRYNNEWLLSDVSEPYRRTLLWSLDEAAYIKKGDEPLFDAYMRILPLAVNFEQTVETDYLGPSIMARLHNRFSNPGTDIEAKQLAVISGQLKDAERRWIAAHQRDRSIVCPKDHEIWHLIQRIVLNLRNFPDLYEVWKSEMGEFFSVAYADHFPTKKGGCWL